MCIARVSGLKRKVAAPTTCSCQFTVPPVCLVPLPAQQERVAVKSFQQYALLKQQGFAEPPPELACTELPQQWRRPRQKGIKPASVLDVDWRAPREGGVLLPVTARLSDASLDEASQVAAIQTLGAELEAMGDFPFAAVLVDVQAPLGLETNTRQQGLSDRWHAARHHHLTASIFGTVIKRKGLTQQGLRNLLDPKDLSRVRAIQYGKKNESFAAERDATTMKAGGHNVTLQHCGLAVHPSCPWLGASPDRLTFHPEEGTYGVVEVMLEDEASQARAHSPLSAVGLR
ncbi:hypothetical protein HPB49_003972 [Dermacentor silvarum]|uniref:Uncharacterized protein n=1 Tax=Dermacentor silvarum TaxID=543639 RepID=A0ACB8DUD7_DERSI|nr:hypothetical protein HPB49_003972 [Dermacentor silvarum]